MANNTTTPNELLGLSLDGDVYENFINSIRTETSKQFYIFALKKFMIYRNVLDVRELLPPLLSSFIYSHGDIKKIESDIISWLVHLRKVETSAYPSKADIENLGLKAQGKEWEI